MQYLIHHLKETYPALGKNGADPFAEIYHPDNLTEMERDDQLHPCLVICPGGAYAFCSQRECEPIALHFLSSEYNIFILHYSCAPHCFPTQLREAAALVELIHQNAAAWHCDPSRIAIMGFSAGGHLAAHYSNTYDHPLVRELFPDSKPVQASILCYPVLTAAEGECHRSTFENLAGHKNLTPEECGAFSCEKLVTERTPPTFLWHTCTDPLVPVFSTLYYSTELARPHVPFESHIVPVGGHGLATATPQTCDNLPPEVIRNSMWMDLARDWLEIVWNTRK